MKTGSEPLFFQWIKNGNILNNDLQSNYKISASEDHSQFLIKNVHRSDSGNYSCIVRNAFGTDIQSTQLNIKGLLKNDSINYYLTKIMYSGSNMG